MTPHSGYRGPSHHSMAGDSGYFHSGSRSAKSYSDTDFGLRHTTASTHMPYSMTPQTYQMSHAMHVSFIFSRHLSCLVLLIRMSSEFQGNDRVTDWLRTSGVHNEQSAFVKTSPRGSGRHQKRTRSQDRYGLQHPHQPPQMSVPHQHQYNLPPMSTYGFGDTSLVAEASRRLARQNPNQSLPLSMSSSGATTSESITAKYIFPQSKDELPFLVKIPQTTPITLGDVKRHLPKKGIYRFFFKTDMDGEEVLQEESNDAALVPLWKGNMVVQCRME